MLWEGRPLGACAFVGQCWGIRRMRLIPQHSTAQRSTHAFGDQPWPVCLPASSIELSKAVEVNREPTSIAPISEPGRKAQQLRSGPKKHRHGELGRPCVGDAGLAAYPLRCSAAEAGWSRYHCCWLDHLHHRRADRVRSKVPRTLFAIKGSAAFVPVLKWLPQRQVRCMRAASAD